MQYDENGDAIRLDVDLSKSEDAIIIETAFAPPKEINGLYPLLDPDTTPLTSIEVATVGEAESPTTITVDKATEYNNPIVLQIGDNMNAFKYYKKVPAAGVQYTFDIAGKYTIRATNNNGLTFVETQVTIPKKS